LISVLAIGLGQNATELRRNMHYWFHKALSWRAILVFDSMDIYLIPPSTQGNLQAKEMQDALLEGLERHKCVLFLLTRNVGAFDEAVRFRIDMFPGFPSLTAKAQEQIWRNSFHEVTLGSHRSLRLSYHLDVGYLQNLLTRSLNVHQLRRGEFPFSPRDQTGY
jgi:hypothetical protein